MNEFIYFINNNYLYIIIVVTIILSILLFISISGLNLNQPKNESKLVQEVTVEMFTENINTLGQGQGQEILNEFKITTPSESFCQSYIGNSKELEPACNRLTNKNCDITSCCVRTIDNKCLAGSANGPTYHENNSSNDSSYYYLGKCYGTEC
jgi:hypothetical protein